jgi:SRSO17 transposase
MDTERNVANSARWVVGPDDDGQNVQQCLSDSPWSAHAVIHQVQQEIAAPPGLRTGGVVLLEERPDEQAGPKRAGAGRQQNGRWGNVEMRHVGTFLAFDTGEVWTWVDGELFVPESWFVPEMGDERERVGIPAERQCATTIAWGWRMIQRVTANGLPFEAVACDDLSGRSGWLRHRLDAAAILSMAAVPDHTVVYLTTPEDGVPPPRSAQRGRTPPRPQVVSADAPVDVRPVTHLPETSCPRVRVRSTERGEWDDPVAMRRVWTIRDGELAEEWLVIRYEYGQRSTSALSNASTDTPMDRLAWLNCVRHVVERATQDATSDIGWDEVQAQKERAWDHHLAVTILATWCIAHTKHAWAHTSTRDPALAQQVEREVLPALSVANVRELLQTVLPMPQVSPEQATRLVVNHVIHRARSTRSRLKTQHRKRGPT